MPDESRNQTFGYAWRACLCSAKLMDQHRFAEARVLLDKLLALDLTIDLKYSFGLTNDALFCELIGECRPEVIEKLRDEKYNQFVMQFRRKPCVLRGQYAYALLYRHDEAEAEKYLRDFEKLRGNCPYTGELISESELIGIARAAAQGKIIENT